MAVTVPVMLQDQGGQVFLRCPEGQRADRGGKDALKFHVFFSLLLFLLSGYHGIGKNTRGVRNLLFFLDSPEKL
jgi:hypothetical protein